MPAKAVLWRLRCATPASSPPISRWRLRSTGRVPRAAKLAKVPNRIRCARSPSARHGRWTTAPAPARAGGGAGGRFQGGGVEHCVLCSGKGKRVWPCDGQRQDQTNRQHGHQRNIYLPRRPVPQRHKGRPARRTDQPDKYRERQRGIGQRKAARPKRRLQYGRKNSGRCSDTMTAPRPISHRTNSPPSGPPTIGSRPVQFGTAVNRNPAMTAPR